MEKSGDVEGLAQGTRNLISQFKPHALERANARQLVMTDSSYSTPADAYFGYLARRKQQQAGQEAEEFSEQERARETQVLKNIDTSGVIPSYYNLESGKFEL
jgi:hypothetical protein